MPGVCERPGVAGKSGRKKDRGGRTQTRPREGEVSTSKAGSGDAERFLVSQTDHLPFEFLLAVHRAIEGSPERMVEGEQVAIFPARKISTIKKGGQYNSCRGVL